MIQKPLHYNIPQLRSMIVDAPHERAIEGRGTGKTEGIIAPKSRKRMDTMPRSCGVFVAATFQQLLTRTLPPVIKGWEKLGYKFGVHYLIGQRPPERWRRMWKWCGPYQLPLKYEYFISWWNGAGIQLISQDRIGSSNGLSIDYIMGDEAKLLKYDRLKEELFPANRGLIAAFSNDPHHHGTTFTSDMPVGTSGRWLLDSELDMDKEKIRQIFSLQAKIQQLQVQQQSTSNRRLIQDCSAFIKDINAVLDLLRKDLVYYHEASTLDNLAGLGTKFIRQLMRDLDDFTFSTAILNRKPRRLEDGFYPDLDEDIHGYFAYDYNKFHNIGYDFETLSGLGSEIDADYDSEKVFHIALDNNRRLTPMPVVQRTGYELKVINYFYSEDPEKIWDTVYKFCDYYQYHNNKIVYFWHDHTLIAQFGHASSAAAEVIKSFRKKGWTVVERYIGQATEHAVRYMMYGHLLQEDGHYRWKVRFNRDKTQLLLDSMFLTPAIKRKDGFGKDKSSELDPNVPAIESTHGGEALDMITTGILLSGLEVESEIERPSMDLI